VHAFSFSKGTVEKSCTLCMEHTYCIAGKGQRT